jgi:hypothetical protein
VPGKVGPAGPPATGGAPAKGGQAGAPAKAPAGKSQRAKTAGKGTGTTEAGKPAKVTEWATIEKLRPETTWVGQELTVWNDKPGKDGHAWMLKVTEKVTEGKATRLTLVSFDEWRPGGHTLPAGNVYTVTHPYVGRPDRESVLLVIAERKGLKPKGSKDGMGIFYTFVDGIDRAMARARERRRAAGAGAPAR